MKQPRVLLLRRSLALLGVLTICLGATSKSCSIANSGSGGDEPSFVTSLSVQDASSTESAVFERGDEIKLVLTIRNRLDSSPTVDLPDSRTTDFVVVRENTNDVVWKWSKHGTTVTATPGTLQFSPFQTQSITEIWNQEDDNGDQVRAGSYEARGVVMYSGFDANPLQSNQLGSTLVRFTIN